MNFTYIDIVIAYDNQDTVIQIITWNSKDILQFTKMAYLHKENNNCFNSPIFLFINIISTAKTSQSFLKVLNISNVQVNTKRKTKNMNDLIWNKIWVW